MKTKLNDRIFWQKSRSREFCSVNNSRNNCEESRNASKTTSFFLQHDSHLKVCKKVLYLRFEIQCKASQYSHTRFIDSKFNRKVLRRSMIEKYSSKNIDDKRLISIKFNLIYWSEYWLFNVLQLTSIEIYLYFTIYEMNNFDVELDSYLNRFHVVRWISRNEILRESFNKFFVLKSFAHFVIRSLKI
jgi:hypothetical protein